MMLVLVASMLLPFFGNIYWVFTRLRPEVKKKEKCYGKILQVSKAYVDKGEDGVIEFMDKEFLKNNFGGNPKTKLTRQQNQKSTWTKEDC